MLMLFRVGVEPGARPRRTDTADDAPPLQHAQGAVNGIERDRGNPLADPGVDRLCVRMLVRPGQLAQDLGPLMRRLDLLAVTERQEGSDLFLDLFDGDHRAWFQSVIIITSE